MVEQTRNINIEFLGMPGTGKTTVSKITSELLRGDAGSVSEPTYCELHGKTKYERQLNRIRHVCRIFRVQPGPSFKTLRIVFRSKQNSWDNYRASILNLFTKLSLFESNSPKDEVAVYDEGLVHSYWGVISESQNKQYLTDVFYEYMSLWLSRIQYDTWFFILLETDPKELAERLRVRNSSVRLDQKVYAHPDPEQFITDIMRDYQLLVEDLMRISEQDSRLVFVRVSNKEKEQTAQTIYREIMEAER